MEYIERIQATLDYMEHHLDRPVTMEELAKVACFSVFHFHRLFVLTLGDTAIDYLRKRRLAKAAELLRTTDQRVLDIALMSGFQSHETFARAFKRQFQLTPLEYRKSGVSLALQPFVTLPLAPRLSKGGIMMTPTIVTKSAFKLIGYGFETETNDGSNHEDIPAFWQRYLQENLRVNIPNKLRPNVEIGMCTNFEPETGRFTYVIGYEAESFDNVPEGLMCLTVPEATYAVFTSPKASQADFVSSIQETWNQAYQEWFPTSGYQACSPEFECYDERAESDTNKQVEIYIAIVKE